MGAPKVLRLRWAVPPAALVLLSSGLWLSTQPARRFPAKGEQSMAFSPAAGPGAINRLSRNDLNGMGLVESKESNAKLQTRGDNGSVWNRIAQKVDGFKDSVGSPEWFEFGDNIKNYIVPEWSRYLPATLQKLQRELSMSPGSLADEIWKDAQDVDINPEIAREATVRVGNSLCTQEVAYRRKRRLHVVKALASYLDVPEDEIHPDDVPIIAMCGSGGGLRALVAGTGSYIAAQEAGLWSCVTYTAGVSGSCWLQTLYHSSFINHDFHKLMDHLKNKLGVHIAFPPKALYLLTTAPTSKYLLSGLIEKMKADPNAELGVVDVYGLLLAARLLVPKGELGVSDIDLKLSNQVFGLSDGSQPLPIYTAVRHEIPIREAQSKNQSASRPIPEKVVKESERESWFQWFEFTPYEFFSEELNAGIPTWALGRHFNGGENIIPSGQYPIPELRIPQLMGIWGSAFCATLSHYYKEIRPLIKGITGFDGIDSLIEGKNEDLVRVHLIDPAAIPNFALGMKDRLPPSCPESIFRSEYLQLMDAGMSNNLPIYPLIRPGREVDIIVAFDASADIKQENWLSVVDGYARQRGIKGWPVGAGWPKQEPTLEDAKKGLQNTQDISEEKVNKELATAQQASLLSHTSHNPRMPEVHEHNQKVKSSSEKELQHNTDLTYCNVWVGIKEERITDEEPPPSKRLFHPQERDNSDSDFHLMRPDVGIAVVYFPLLPNPTAPELPLTSSISQQHVASGSSPTQTSANVTDSTQLVAPHPSTIHPDVDDFLSTWNFVYTPEQIDAVVGLAKANFAQGEEQVKRVVRAVYERKKADRLRREQHVSKARSINDDQGSMRRLEGFVPI